MKSKLLYWGYIVVNNNSSKSSNSNSNSNSNCNNTNSNSLYIRCTGPTAAGA